MAKGKLSTMRMEDIRPYPNNPRKNDGAVDAVAESIRQCGYVAPIIVDEDGVILAGHTRYKALQKLGYKTADVLIKSGMTEEQKKKYRLLDNKTSELADWDYDLLEMELDGLDFGSLDLNWSLNSDWFSREEKDGNAEEDGNEEYNEFLKKFEAKKTTDDCYTPDEVYEAVANWVAAEYGLSKNTFFRPFYPGGDYQKENYEGKVVVDNPPFSILAEIKRFYTDRGVRFFMFAPTLTLFSAADCEATYIPCGVAVTYENGASVNTSFVTNLEDADVIVKTAPSLYKAVDESNKRVQAAGKVTIPKYEYPDNVLTAAIAARWCKYGVEYALNRNECVKVTALDAQKESGDAIYGGGFLLAERAAAERAAAERAAAERAAATKWKLSERELEIVRGLGGDTNTKTTKKGMDAILKRRASHKSQS